MNPARVSTNDEPVADRAVDTPRPALRDDALQPDQVDSTDVRWGWDWWAPCSAN
jgi:hypothetical protein